VGFHLLEESVKGEKKGARGELVAKWNLQPREGGGRRGIKRRKKCSMMRRTRARSGPYLYIDKGVG